jgi:hypothetical protein
VNKKIVFENMELPPELVGIIRAFSKPLFSYAKEYKEVLAIENVYQWPELKEKLYKNELLPLVKTYLEYAKQKKESGNDHLSSRNFIASANYANARDDLIIAVFDGNPRWDWWMEHSTWWNEDHLREDDDE